MCFMKNKETCCILWWKKDSDILLKQQCTDKETSCILKCDMVKVHRYYLKNTPEVLILQEGPIQLNAFYLMEL